MVTGAERWLVTFSFTQKAEGGWRGEVGGGKAINSQSLFPYWCASSSKTPPPKCSITYPKSIIDWDQVNA